MGNSSPLQYKRATCLVSRDRLYWKVWHKFRLRSKVTAKEFNSLVQCLLTWPFFPFHLLMTIKTERGKFSLSEPGASNGQFICIITWHCSQIGPICMCCFHNIAFTVSPGLLVKQYKRPVLVAFSSQYVWRLFCFKCRACYVMKILTSPS